MDMNMGDDGTNGSAKRGERCSPHTHRNILTDSESSGQRDRARDRDRHRRGDRPSRFQDRSPSNDDRERERGGRRAPADRRVYISNIPYEFRWQDLKDLFRSEVGEVEYVELFADEGDKPRGCGIIEFSCPDSVKKAIEKMHRHEVRGRKLVVKEDFDMERDSAGRLMSSSGGGGGGSGGGGGGGTSGRSNSISRREEPQRSSRWQANDSSPRPVSPNQKGWGFTYGLSPAFLESLGIKGPLVNRVFVANLDYKVDEKKLQEVFKLAGKVATAELNKDKDGKSRGHGVVEYEHPVEAVQAISMLHHQMLFDRLLTVRMDRVNEKNEGQPPKLPEGLRGIGMGLGEGGKPLQDVSRSLPANLQNAQLQQSMNMASMQPAGLPSLASQGALGGIPGLANMQNSMGSIGGMGMSFPGSTGVGSLMGAGNLGGGLASLGGSAGSLGMLGPGLASAMGNSMSSNMGQGGAGDMNMPGLTGGLGNSGMATSNMGGLASSSMVNSGGFGNSSNNLGMGANSLGTSSSFNSGGMNQMPSGSFMSSSLGASSGFGIGGSNSSGPGFGNRNFEMQPSYNSMDDRDFRTTGFNGQIKMESNLANPSLDRKPPESDTVVVRNLAPSVTWQTLRDKFREFGEVKFAEIRNKDTGLVRFASVRDAQRAADMMDRSRIDGRVVDVLLY